MQNTVDSILLSWAQVASALLLIVIAALVLTVLWDVVGKRLFGAVTERKTSALRKILGYFANVEIGNQPR